MRELQALSVCSCDAVHSRLFKIENVIKSAIFLFSLFFHSGNFREQIFKYRFLREKQLVEHTDFCATIDRILLCSLQLSIFVQLRNQSSSNHSKHTNKTSHLGEEGDEET